MTRTGQTSRCSSIRRNLISAVPRRSPQPFLNVALQAQPIVLTAKPGDFCRRIRNGMHGRPRSRTPPLTAVAPIAQHRGRDPQLAGDLQQRPAAARQQADRLSLELIRDLTPSLVHSTPFRSPRSLAKVSTNSGEAQLSLGWYRIVPYRSYVKGWKISPSHFLNQDLATIWLDKKRGAAVRDRHPVERYRS